jgi:hypothetical protein
MMEYYEHQEEKEMRLAALGREEDFVDTTYGHWRYVQLDKGEWDQESLPGDDADSVAALEEEYPGIFCVEDRGPKEGKRDYMMRKYFEFYEDDMNDDDMSDDDMGDNDSDALLKRQINADFGMGECETDETSPLTIHNPFKDKDQYVLSVHKDTALKCHWVLFDPNNDEDSSTATSDDEDKDYRSLDDETKAQRRADRKLADLEDHDPHHDGKQTTLEIMNIQGTTYTKWSLQHPSFRDEKQLKLMVIKDDQTGDPMWKMIIVPRS